MAFHPRPEGQGNSYGFSSILCNSPITEKQISGTSAEGGIAAREVKVTINNFPDYCFNDDYPLMPLADLKNYISLNKHLPEMPTAQEIENDNGVEIGELQTKLVKKVEEQTLYILNLQKQIDEMKNQLEMLMNK